jgi:hypothetical protein
MKITGKALIFVTGDNIEAESESSIVFRSFNKRFEVTAKDGDWTDIRKIEGEWRDFDIQDRIMFDCAWVIPEITQKAYGEYWIDWRDGNTGKLTPIKKGDWTKRMPAQ